MSILDHIVWSSMWAYKLCVSILDHIIVVKYAHRKFVPVLKIVGKICANPQRVMQNGCIQQNKTQDKVTIVYSLYCVKRCAIFLTRMLLLQTESPTGAIWLQPSRSYIIMCIKRIWCSEWHFVTWDGATQIWERLHKWQNYVIMALAREQIVENVSSTLLSSPASRLILFFHTCTQALSYELLVTQ